MNTFWFISIIISWMLLIGAILVILALAREVEVLHRRLDSLQTFLRSPDWSNNGKEHVRAVSEINFAGEKERPGS